MNAPAKRMLTIDCAGQHYAFGVVRSPVFIGRSADADVPVADPRVAPAHVRLEFDSGTWTARDNGSRTGMYVDGARLDLVEIRDGLVVRIGGPDGASALFGFSDSDAERLNAAVFSPRARLIDDEVDSGIARAGAAVAARRRELDITQRTLAKYRIMNAGALIAFEKGRSWPRERTRAKLEEVLQWPPGTIANIRNGGAAPGARSDGGADDQAPLILGAVEVAMKTFTAAVEALPDPGDPDFANRAAVVLTDMRRLESVVARAARQSRGMPAVVMALSEVRKRYEALALAAGDAPDATLGQRLFAARRRANLTAAETANAVGVSTELIEAVEGGEPATDEDTGAIDAFVAQLMP